MSCLRLLLATLAFSFGSPSGRGSCWAFVIPTQVLAHSTTTTSSLSAGDQGSSDAKVVLVTGSSRGLGKAIAMEIGKAGQKVVINYVSDGSKEAAETTVKEIEEAGGQALAVQADSKSNAYDVGFYSCLLNARCPKLFLVASFACRR